MDLAVLAYRFQHARFDDFIDRFGDESRRLLIDKVAQLATTETG
jgi:hypothetical protein